MKAREPTEAPTHRVRSILVSPLFNSERSSYPIYCQPVVVVVVEDVGSWVSRPSLNCLLAYQRKATSGVGYSRRGVLNFNQWQKKERKIQWQSSLHFSGGSLAAEQLHPHITCCTWSPKKPPLACEVFSTLFTEKVEREVSLLCGQPEPKSNHLRDPVTLRPLSLHLWMVELALAWVQWQH